MERLDSNYMIALFNINKKKYYIIFKQDFVKHVMQKRETRFLESKRKNTPLMNKKNAL